MADAGALAERDGRWRLVQEMARGAAGDGRAGDPGPDRPARPGQPRRAAGGLGDRPPLRHGAAERGGGRRRRSPGRAARAAAARPRARGAPLAGAGVPLQARADPGGRLPHARARTRRRELHARAATWLEERHADAPEEVYALLAHHWLEAADDERAMRYLARAGDRATPQLGAGRGDRPLPRAAGAAGAARRQPRRRRGALQAGARPAHVDAVRRGEPCLSAGVRAVAAAGGCRPPPPRRCGSPPATCRGCADPTRAGWWADIRLGMQLFDRLVGRRARADDPAVAGRALGDLRRRPALPLPPPRGLDVVGRRSR